MKEDRFKKIYDLAYKLQIKCYKEEYERILEIDSNIGTFEDFVNNEIEKINNSSNKKSKKNSFILNEKIKKDNITINIYLIHFKKIESVELDENYKVLPLKENEIFQYGTIISMPLVDGCFDINDMFSNFEYSEKQAKNKYKNLKKHLIELTEDELLNEIENSIKNELNS